MARILFLHIRYPEFDRCSGDLRVTNMLQILARSHAVALHVLHQPPGYLEAEANRAYAERLATLGIRTSSGSLIRQLRHARYDVIVVEFWYVALPIIRQLRALQPEARILVDTEHVYFYADQLRVAALGASPAKTAEYARSKQAELDAYRKADGVLTTTDEDRNVLLAVDPSIRTRTVPNIHALADAPVGRSQGRRPHSVLFIGNYRNNPSNVDAMTWFCGAIMPRLVDRFPDATLRIVGNMPPPEVVALASANVEVTGYVPETGPYLDASQVSVCPLRFGAGLKGKIGEAMMRGLPVVTTSVGIQGMQPRVGEDLLVADDPELYAEAIVRLFEDADLWQTVSLAGRDFIERHFGFAAVEKRLEEVFGDLSWLAAKRMSSSSRRFASFAMTAGDLLEAHVLWRWQR